jgi:hypothetical protein
LYNVAFCWFYLKEYVFIVDSSIKYLLIENNARKVFVMTTINTYIAETDICCTAIHIEVTLGFFITTMVE